MFTLLISIVDGMEKIVTAARDIDKMNKYTLLQRAGYNGERAERVPGGVALRVLPAQYPLSR